MNFLLLCLMGLIFYIPNQLHFPSTFGVPGVNVLNVFFVFIVIIYIAKRKEKSNPAPLKGRIFALYFVLIYGFIVAQIRYTPDFLYDISILKTALFAPMLYFLFYFAVRDKASIRYCILTLLAVAGIAALEAIKEGLSYGVTTFHDTKRAAGPFGSDFRDANRAGVFYAMFFPLFLAGFMFYRKELWVRAACGLGSFCAISALFFTFSRQAYLIALFAGIYLVFKRGVVAPILALILLINYELWVPQAAIDRITGTQQTTELGDDAYDESTMSRFELWSAAGGMALDYPWGIGLNRFKHEVGNYSNIHGKDAHNHYVLVTAELSIIGLIIHLILMFSLVGIGRSLARIAVTNEEKAIGYGFTACAFCMMLGNIYGSPFFTVEVMGNFWIAAALVTRYTELVVKEQKEKKAERAKSFNSGESMAGVA